MTIEKTVAGVELAELMKHFDAAVESALQAKSSPSDPKLRSLNLQRSNSSRADFEMLIKSTLAQPVQPTDIVTRESAMNAIEHLALSNVGNRDTEAENMLVSAAPARPAEPPAPWHHRILNANPKSEPEFFWSDKIKLKYMAEELAEYRKTIEMLHDPLDEVDPETGAHTSIDDDPVSLVPGPS